MADDSENTWTDLIELNREAWRRGVPFIKIHDQIIKTTSPEALEIELRAIATKVEIMRIIRG